MTQSHTHTLYLARKKCHRQECRYLKKLEQVKKKDRKNKVLKRPNTVSFFKTERSQQDLTITCTRFSFTPVAQWEWLLLNQELLCQMFCT